MNDKTTSARTQRRDRPSRTRLAETTATSSAGETDWVHLRNMTDAEVEAAARTDADNPPRTREQLAQMKPRPRVYVIRRALRLTQEQFAERFRIPLGTVRDWEQGRTEPDQAAQAYLKVIAVDPEFVARAHHIGRGKKPKTR